MSQMKTTQCHPRKREQQFYCVLTCVLSLFMALVWCIKPELKILSCILFVGFGAAACVSGYFGFYHSNDWFRAREKKEAIWLSKHPHLAKAVTVLFCLFIIEQLCRMVWVFFKH